MGVKSLIKDLMHTKNPLLFDIRQKLLGLTFIENIAFHANMSDEEYINMKYKERFGIYPNLENPKNFNEKNNWRKLHDRKDIYTLMVDKYRIKDVIFQRVGSDHTFPLFGVWDTPDLIDWNLLPDKFVLKCNHMGGGY